MSFDPYHQWLGIPPAEQPPDFYQLLGICRFEQNPTVISHASERQLLMLKTMQNGPHGALTQRLMNEITAAQIRLLDPQKKAQYDTALRRQLDTRAAAQPPLPASPVEEVTVRPPPIGESVPAAIQTGPRSALAIQQYRDRKGRSTGRLGSKRLAVLTVAVTAVAIAISLAVLMWMPDAQNALQTPQAADNQASSRRADPMRVAESRVAESRVAESRVAESHAQAGAHPTDVPSSRPQGLPARTSAADSTAGMSPTQSEMASRTARGLPPTTSNQPVAGTTGPSIDDPATTGLSSEAASEPADASGLPSATESAGETAEPATGSGDDTRARSQLPSQLNLRDTIAATRTNYVFVGTLTSPANGSWRVAIDDYAAPIGRTRFSVGKVTDQQARFRWPLYRTAPGDSTSVETTTPDSTGTRKAVARIEAGATELSLWISDPEDHELIGELSMCGLMIDAGSSKHHIQLAVHRSIPPMLLKFDKARQTITLGELPSIEVLPPERVLLEIVQVDRSEGGLWEGSGVRNAYDEDISVPLNSDLHCEMDVKLTRNDQQYSISVMPRFLQNNRRQPMVPNTITKEIAQAKSQLTKNQRDLSEAQNSLRVLPREISRVRAMVPRTPPEIAAKQGQLSRLAGMADSMQSRVRRLSKVIPDQIATIQQMERVLAYAQSLSDRVTLHVRVYARGDLQDYLLLESAVGSASTTTGS